MTVQNRFISVTILCEDRSKAMRLSRGCTAAIEKLNNAGFEAYAVGGCVRDLMMDRVPKDFDVTTNAVPEQTMEVFEDCQVIPTGLKFGTVTVIIENELIEITTFRTDGRYLDNRRPEDVSYVNDVKEDLSRRDFTINAMAYSPVTGLVDPFGGREDIKNGLIRAVGDPVERFSEDALRILRAYRFMSRYHFRLEENTKKAMLERMDTINNVASERILKEIKETFESGEDIFNLDFVPVLFPVIAECFDMYQNNRYHYRTVGEHTYMTFNAIENRFDLKLAMLFHDIGKIKTKTTDSSGQDHFYGHPEVSCMMAGEILDRLHVDRKTRESVLTLIRYHDWYVPPRRKSIKKAFARLGKDTFFDLVKVWIADDSAKTPELVKGNVEYYRSVEAMAREILSEDEPYTLRDLAVNGYDMIELGLKDRQVGKMLDYLLSLVMSDSSLNEKDILIKKAMEKMEK